MNMTSGGTDVPSSVASAHAVLRDRDRKEMK